MCVYTESSPFYFWLVRQGVLQLSAPSQDLVRFFSSLTIITTKERSLVGARVKTTRTSVPIYKLKAPLDIKKPHVFCIFCREAPFCFLPRHRRYLVILLFVGTITRASAISQEIVQYLNIDLIRRGSQLRVKQLRP